VDDVEDAKDTGIDDESAYTAGEDGQQPGQGGNPDDQQQGGAPPPPPPGGPQQ